MTRCEYSKRLPWKSDVWTQIRSELRGMWGGRDGREWENALEGQCLVQRPIP